MTTIGFKDDVLDSYARGWTENDAKHLFESHDREVLENLQLGYLTADFILPLSYGPFFSTLLFFALKNLTNDPRIPSLLLTLYPFAALSMIVMTLLDIGENYFIYNLISQYLKDGTINSDLCAFGSMLTSMKFVIPMVSLFPYFIFFLFQLIFRNKAPLKKE